MSLTKTSLFQKVLLDVLRVYVFYIEPRIEAMRSHGRRIRKMMLENGIARIEIVDVGSIQRRSVYAPSMLWLWLCYMAQTYLDLVWFHPRKEYVLPYNTRYEIALVHMCDGQVHMVRPGKRFVVPPPASSATDQVCALPSKRFLSCVLSTGEGRLDITEFMNRRASVFTEENRVNFTELYVMLFLERIIHHNHMYLLFVMTDSNELSLMENVSLKETTLKSNQTIVIP